MNSWPFITNPDINPTVQEPHLQGIFSHSLSTIYQKHSFLHPQEQKLLLLSWVLQDPLKIVLLDYLYQLNVIFLMEGSISCLSISQKVQINKYLINAWLHGLKNHWLLGDRQPEASDRLMQDGKAGSSAWICSSRLLSGAILVPESTGICFSSTTPTFFTALHMHLPRASPVNPPHMSLSAYPTCEVHMISLHFTWASPPLQEEAFFFSHEEFKVQCLIVCPSSHREYLAETFMKKNAERVRSQKYLWN